MQRTMVQIVVLFIILSSNIANISCRVDLRGKFNEMMREIFDDVGDPIEPSRLELLLDTSNNFYSYNISRVIPCSRDIGIQVDDIRLLLGLKQDKICSSVTISRLHYTSKTLGKDYVSLEHFLRSIIESLNERCKKYLDNLLSQLTYSIVPLPEWARLIHHLNLDEKLDIKSIISEDPITIAKIEDSFQKLIEERILLNRNIDKRIMSSFVGVKKEDIRELRRRVCHDVRNLDLNWLKQLIKLYPESKIMDEIQRLSKIGLDRRLVCSVLENVDPIIIISNWAIKSDLSNEFKKIFFETNVMRPDDINILLRYIIYASKQHINPPISRQRQVESAIANRLLIPFDKPECSDEEINRLVVNRLNPLTEDIIDYYDFYLPRYITKCIEDVATDVYISSNSIGIYPLFEKISKANSYENISYPMILPIVLGKNIAEQFFPQGLPAEDFEKSFAKLKFKIEFLSNVCEILKSKLNPIRDKYLSIVNRLKSQSQMIYKETKFIMGPLLVGAELCDSIKRGDIDSNMLAVYVIRSQTQNRD